VIGKVKTDADRGISVSEKWGLSFSHRWGKKLSRVWGNTLAIPPLEGNRRICENMLIPRRREGDR
jgi:hypothetical protein